MRSSPAVAIRLKYLMHAMHSNMCLVQKMQSFSVGGHLEFHFDINVLQKKNERH